MNSLRFALVCLVLAGVGFVLPFPEATVGAAICFFLFVLLLAAGLAVPTSRRDDVSSIRREFRLRLRAAGPR